MSAAAAGNGPRDLRGSGASRFASSEAEIIMCRYFGISSGYPDMISGLADRERAETMPKHAPDAPRSIDDLDRTMRRPGSPAADANTPNGPPLRRKSRPTPFSCATVAPLEGEIAGCRDSGTSSGYPDMICGSAVPDRADRMLEFPPAAPRVPDCRDGPMPRLPASANAETLQESIP